MPRHRVRTAHRMPGRIRLKLDGGSARKAHDLEELKRVIASMPGVHRVETNPASGSVVVHYDPKLYGRFHHQLKEHGDSTGTFHLDVPDIGEGGDLIKSVEEEADFLAEHSETARVLVNGFRSLDRAVKRATDNTVDLKVLLPLGLAIYSFVEIGIEAATPLWITLGIFSFNSFVQLHSPRPGGARSKRAIREVLAESAVPEPRAS
jgi:hypothetical protein